MADILDFRVKNGLLVTTTATIQGTTQSTSSTTGALLVTGGVGIRKDLYVGGAIYGSPVYSNGSLVLTTSTLGLYGVSSIIAGTDTAVSTATGDVTIWGTSTLQSVTARGATTNQALTVTNATTSTTTATGALVVTAGVGIGGNLNVGGNVTIGGSITGSITTATHLAGGTIGQVPYQTAVGRTAFTGPGTLGNLFVSGGAAAPGYLATGVSGTILTSAGSGSNPSWNNTLVLAGITEATSTATGALQVRGGVGINRSAWIGQRLNVGSDAIITGNAFVNGGTFGTSQATFNLVNTTATTVSFAGAGTLITIGASGSGSTTVRNKFTVTDTTNATSTVTGAVSVRGGASVGQDVYVGGVVDILSTASSTSSIAANALYVAGGVGIGSSLYVQGKAYFQDDVVFSGTSTYVYSTQTLYTDNLINLHVPSGSTGTSHTWTVDDGKDIGHVFHYYTGTDRDAFLGLATGSKFLEWWSNGTETNGVYVGSTWGTFKTGSIILTNTTASTTTATGALTVAGGVGIGGSMFVGGNVTVAGTINATVTGVITTATNLAGGTAGRVPYQTGAGLTSFTAAGTAGTILTSNGTSAPTWNNTLALAGTTQASSTVTGALTVAGGAGIRGNLWIGGTLNFFPEASDFASISSTASGSNTYFNFNMGDDPGQSDTWRWRFLPSGANEFSAMELDVTSTTTALLSVTGDIAAVTIVASGDVSVNGGDLQTNQATFNLLNTTATTINFGGTSTAMTVGANTAGYVLIRNNSDATSTATGALRVNGGVGVNRDVWVGQRLNVGSDAIITGDVSVNGGDLLTNQSIFALVNTTATTINFGGAGTAITIGATTGATTIRNNTTVTSITSATSTATGAFQVRGGVGIGGDLYVGGTINGTISGAGNANNVLTTATSTASNYFLTFVDSNNAVASYEAVYTDAGIQYNPSSNDLLLAGDLQVQGGDLTTNQTTFNLLNSTATTINFGGASTIMNVGAAGAGYVQIKNNSAAGSTSSGALRVDGGVGINGALYAGNIFTNGSQVIPFKMQEFTATASQTTFTVTGGYVVGTVMVFANGIFLNSGDFTASNGTTVVLNIARSTGDIIKVVAGGTSSAANQSQAFSVAMSVALSM